MAMLKQTWTLTKKNILIALNRHWFLTSIRAFILPVAFIIFLSYARNLFVAPSTYGIGTAQPVRTLQEGFADSTSSRKTIVFVNNGYSGGDIDRVIGILADQATAAGKTVKRLTNTTDITKICPSSLRGVTLCYGAVDFTSSPSEGSGGRWNYTIRADGALGTSIWVDRTNNDAEVYLLPLQHAVDFAIASINSTVDQNALPSQVLEYPFTDLTQAEWERQIRVNFQQTILDTLGVAYFVGMVGVVYHLSGFVATERELGMSQLIDAMMPNLKRWQPTVARLLSHHAAFSIIYAPGWIIIGLVLALELWTQTSKAILIFFHLLTGLALASWAILGAAFFKKAQLSGISISLLTLVLGIIAQAFDQNVSGAAVGVLSFLFVPCNYVYFLILMARYEQQDEATDLIHRAPNNWPLPGIAFFVFLIIQIFLYPILALLVERRLHGTASKGRKVVRGLVNSRDEGFITQNTVQLEGFTKHYPPNIFRRTFRRHTSTVIAVDDLNLTATKGQILVLLGANGSGKSTTLDAIAGMNTVTSGTITVDGTGGIGICPQKNVLWAELTVEEHITIFNKLKTSGAYDSKETIHDLIRAVDMDRKINSRSSTLSGGQKRKLQLGMMLTGGSAVCCVDEVSSGLDPLSRRKIWDILLAERGTRSIILTTHFLDEADLLADHIAILSKGTLRASGSSVELKNKLGGGYRIHMFIGPDHHKEAPRIEGVNTHVQFDQITYLAPTSSQAALVVRTLEGHGIHDYQLAGPTIEDVFLQLAEEIHEESQTAIHKTSSQNVNETEINHDEKEATIAAMPVESKDELELLTGQDIGFSRQAWVLFRKRCTLFRRNFLPCLAVLIAPIIAAVLVTRLVRTQTTPSCTPTTGLTASGLSTIANRGAYQLLAGPSADIPTTNATLYLLGLLQGYPVSSLLPLVRRNKTLAIVNSVTDFNNYINANHSSVTPGGFYFGDRSSGPLFAYKGDGSFFNAMFAQNILNSELLNISITTQYDDFTTPWIPGTGNSLQLVVYFGLVMAAIPAFFALYPCVERIRNVRGLQYSNGVRPLPLWLAYLCFDYIFIFISSIMIYVVFRKLSHVWYHVDYLLAVLVLYGMSSILVAYIVSLFARGQLAAFAFAAGIEAVLFLLYLIAYLCTITYASVNYIDSSLLIVHYVMSLITPMGSLIRALFVSLNLFSTTCVGEALAPHPRGLNQFGGPILYLIVQNIVLFAFLLWWDSGLRLPHFLQRRSKQSLVEPESVLPTTDDTETQQELEKATQTTSGLRVLHLTKSFGKTTAVEDLTFGISRGEVFALLGPNGAGKSTTISLIRGDIQPSRNGGEIYVDDIPLRTHRNKARNHLGVCPQFDAMDSLSVQEHLQFYARVRGIPDIAHNVSAVLQAVGLSPFRDRMAAKLSGGNKRKLSLGIALMGNPSVVLLDEPSSGMDAAAKRVMWRTLAGVVAGRAILLTTHSMEEAGALASRAGIMARRMLALGSTEYLRRRFGDAFHVHLVVKGAPHTAEGEMERLRAWVVTKWPGARVEEKTYHGQLRFAVPAEDLIVGGGSRGSESTGIVLEEKEKQDIIPDEKDLDTIHGGRDPLISSSAQGHNNSSSAIGQLITILEDSKDELGLEYYSVSPTTLDQVFLTIVGRHNVEEENYAPPKPKRRWFRLGRKA